MAEFVTVARVGEIPEGQAAAYAVDGRMVAIFNLGDQYLAIDDFCPHMGASLAGGYVEDGTVSCPWHAWRFRLADGAWEENPKIKVRSYSVRVEGDSIQVQLPPAEQP